MHFLLLILIVGKALGATEPEEEPKITTLDAYDLEQAPLLVKAFRANKRCEA
jgi:hypothetical protein